MSTKEKIWTPANIVTVIRICGVPVFIIAILAPWPEAFGNYPLFEALKPWIAAAIFAILAATDGVDGYLARSRNEVTTFGKFIDPIADKILTASALIALVELQVVPSWIVIIILCREFIVSGLRMIAASQGCVIAASWYGKAKTVFQIIAIILFIIKDSLIANLPESIHGAIVFIAWAVMIIALVLTIISMVDYLAKARPLLGFGENLTEENEKCDSSSEVDLDSCKDASAKSNISIEDVHNLSQRVIENARNNKMSLVCAESLTGGLISSQLTSVPGSSEVVLGGFVTYTNQMKHQLLNVDEQVLSQFGAVSEQVVKQMAIGAQAKSGATISVAVSGIAGPSGAEAGKPVGTVWMALCTPSECNACRYQFSGDRDQVRLKTVYQALLSFNDAILNTKSE